MTMTSLLVFLVAFIMSLLAYGSRKEKTTAAVRDGVQQYFYPDGKLY